MTSGNDKPYSDESRTASSLLRGAVRYDQGAWDRLVTNYGPVVYTWSRRAGLQPTDAADMVQEVMRNVARGIGDFHHDQDGDTFRGWLRRITQRRIADFRRKSGRNPAPALGGDDVHEWLHAQIDPINDEPTTSHPAGIIPDEKRRILETVRAKFSDRNWQIFWRVVVEERDTADVAEEFGVSANVVRLVKSRILKRLRETMGDADSDQESDSEHEP